MEEKPRRHSIAPPSPALKYKASPRHESPQRPPTWRPAGMSGIPPIKLKNIVITEPKTARKPKRSINRIRLPGLTPIESSTSEEAQTERNQYFEEEDVNETQHFEFIKPKKQEVEKRKWNLDLYHYILIEREPQDAFLAQ